MPSVPKPGQKEQAKKRVRPSRAKAKSDSAPRVRAEKKPKAERARKRNAGVPLQDGGKIVTVSEAASQLGVTERRVIWLAGKGRLAEQVQDGKRVGIDPASIESYASSMKKSVVEA